MSWTLVFFMALATAIAVPVHRALVRKLNRDQSPPADRNALWFLESALFIGVGALIAGVLAVAMWIVLDAVVQGSFDPLLVLGFISGQCYAFPAAFVVGLVVHARWRRFRCPGRCSHCGYDLTGNTSGRCAECGRVTN